MARAVFSAAADDQGVLTERESEPGSPLCIGAGSLPAAPPYGTILQHRTLISKLKGSTRARQKIGPA
ncbi:MAG: hypothetical protein F4040_07165 [Synechococcus sp. SB0670_bin_20]|nr:hypothetical protein [Synechococcus sp. SB0670_bin_20]